MFHMGVNWHQLSCWEGTAQTESFWERFKEGNSTKETLSNNITRSGTSQFVFFVYYIVRVTESEDKMDGSRGMYRGNA